jgi:HEAT repeat protein
MNSSPTHKVNKSLGDRLLQLVHSESDEDWIAAQRVISRAKSSQLIKVLAGTQSTLLRWALCHRLSRRCAPEAVPVLIQCLDDSDPDVCTEAAEALGNIGDGSAGPALYKRFSDPGACSRNLLAYALGNVGYQHAIPDLVKALSDPDLRGSAAISLASLGAVETQGMLQIALEQETDSWSTSNLIERALSALGFASKILETRDVGSMASSIEEALYDPDPLLNRATVWALQNLGDKEAETLLRDRLAQGKVDCPLRHLIRDALSTLENRQQGIN